MDQDLRHRLADRAFLFDDPKAYLAGVDAALKAIESQQREDETSVDRSSGRAAAPRR